MHQFTFICGWFLTDCKLIQYYTLRGFLCISEVSIWNQWKSSCFSTKMLLLHLIVLLSVAYCLRTDDDPLKNFNIGKVCKCFCFDTFHFLNFVNFLAGFSGSAWCCMMICLLLVWLYLKLVICKSSRNAYRARLLASRSLSRLFNYLLMLVYKCKTCGLGTILIEGITLMGKLWKIILDTP